MENNYLNLMYLLKKLIYHLVRKKKYFISLLPKEWKEQRNYTKVLILII